MIKSIKIQLLPVEKDILATRFGISQLQLDQFLTLLQNNDKIHHNHVCRRNVGFLVSPCAFHTKTNGYQLLTRWKRNILVQGGHVNLDASIAQNMISGLCDYIAEEAFVGIRTPRHPQTTELLTGAAAVEWIMSTAMDIFPFYVSKQMTVSNLTYLRSLQIKTIPQVDLTTPPNSP